MAILKYRPGINQIKRAIVFLCVFVLGLSFYNSIKLKYVQKVKAQQLNNIKKIKLEGQNK